MDNNIRLNGFQAASYNWSLYQDAWLCKRIGKSVEGFFQGVFGGFSVTKVEQDNYLEVPSNHFTIVGKIILEKRLQDRRGAPIDISHNIIPYKKNNHGALQEKGQIEQDSIETNSPVNRRQSVTAFKRNSPADNSQSDSKIQHDGAIVPPNFRPEKTTVSVDSSYVEWPHIEDCFVSVQQTIPLVVPSHSDISEKDECLSPHRLYPRPVKAVIADTGNQSGKVYSERVSRVGIISTAQQSSEAGSEARPPEITQSQEAGKAQSNSGNHERIAAPTVSFGPATGLSGRRGQRGDSSAVKMPVKVQFRELDGFSELTLDQKIRETKAHKMLLGLKLEESVYLERYHKMVSVKGLLTKLVGIRLEKGGINASEVAPERFYQELVDTLFDLNKRGISLGHPGINNAVLCNNLKSLDALIRNYDDVVKLDQKLENHINSSNCKKWDVKLSLYRGGHYHYESKLIRNQQKGKEPYKQGTINHLGLVYGSGLYVSTELGVAHRFKNKKHPGCVKIKIRPDTPVINEEVRKELMSYHESNDLKEMYYSFLCPHSIIMHYKHKAQCQNNEYYTLKSPEVIDDIEVADRVENNIFQSASISRLEDTTGLIKGHPGKFKEVIVPEGKDLAELSAAYIKGDEKSRDRPVYQFTNENDEVEFVMKSTTNKETYWSVKPAPQEVDKSKRNKERVFIVEPSPDFLRNRYLDKIEGLYKSHWSASMPVVEEVWKGFGKHDSNS